MYYDEQTGELEYAIRAKEMVFHPIVFFKGNYTIEAGEPGTQQWKILNGISSFLEPDQRVIKIEF